MRPISIELNVHFPELINAINTGIQLLTTLNEKVNNMATSLDTLTTAVTTNTSVIDSAIALINGIAAQITAAGTDPVALASLVSSLKSEDDALAAAVVANTPAATLAPVTAAARR